MASTGVLTSSERASGWRPDPVLWVRLAIIVGVLVLWQVVAMSGLLYQDVVPQLPAIVAALGRLLVNPELYRNLWVTLYETVLALVFGGVAGLFVGIVLGGSRFFGRAFEPYLYYLGPTPKIIFFPVMIMWFGTGGGSKIAMGAFSCFFPVALSVAVGMRAIPPILMRVGQSFRASPRQMVQKIYLPAMREPVVNGLRLGFGIALIGVLLAETKLSNQGLGFLVIQNYQRFDMPAMYALLIAIFVLSMGANAAITRLTSRSAASGAR
ncbi:ABC transporter permease [Mangrovibrevibacter kandeliae]|uniref:ABC transporter permease n=1 Tax=Mangrovibrevibacter kandeliae TaxID=2968473 RepID=UPI002119991D|nr:MULTISPECIES: ABC transporter permease [unclassified Aurantimonas]MCQ8783062.1 ABC transporter permease [Aurantimonas sp. CSK15Z-1]MCW4115748.1 ABC transporter permease [Aurantimonas sp. MSK8Z-1]